MAEWLAQSGVLLLGTPGLSPGRAWPEFRPPPPSRMCCTQEKGAGPEAVKAVEDGFSHMLQVGRVGACGGVGR